MDANQFIAALSDKIDRREQFEELLVAVYKRVYGPSYTRDFIAHGRHGAYWRVDRVWATARSLFRESPCDRACPSGLLVHEQAGQAVREHLRCHFGVYAMPATSCGRLTSCPGGLGFTRMKTTRRLWRTRPTLPPRAKETPVDRPWPRLLRKFNPTMPDSELAELEATYRSDLSDEIEFITDEEALVEAYLQGPSSCMSHPSKYFDLPEGLHPVQVYADAPGWL